MAEYRSSHQCAARWHRRHDTSVIVSSQSSLSWSITNSDFLQTVCCISIVDVTKYAVTFLLTHFCTVDRIQKVPKRAIALRGDLQHELVVFARDDHKRFCEKGRVAFASLGANVEPQAEFRAREVSAVTNRHPRGLASKPVLLALLLGGHYGL